MVRQKLKDLEVKFNAMKADAISKNDVVFKELQKSIKLCYNFPITMAIRRDYIQKYGRIVVNIAALNRTTFPSIMFGTSEVGIDKKVTEVSEKVVATGRILNIDEKSDFVTVTSNLGDNASMVDLQNDSIPPVG